MVEFKPGDVVVDPLGDKFEVIAEIRGGFLLEAASPLYLPPTTFWESRAFVYSLYTLKSSAQTTPLIPPLVAAIHFKFNINDLVENVTNKGTLFSGKKFLVSGRRLTASGTLTYDLSDGTSLYTDVAEANLKTVQVDPLGMYDLDLFSDRTPVPPAPKPIPNCAIVKSSVLGKEFLYCRTHDDEADSIRCCRKALK